MNITEHTFDTQHDLLLITFGANLSMEDMQKLRADLTNFFKSNNIIVQNEMFVKSVDIIHLDEGRTLNGYMHNLY